MRRRFGSKPRGGIALRALALLLADGGLATRQYSIAGNPARRDAHEIAAHGAAHAVAQ